MNQVDLSIIIPVYNNEATLSKLHSKIVNCLEGQIDSFEILFIDDGSTDHSLENLKSIKKSHSSVLILVNDSNIGQQNSILKGLKVARGNKIAVMDADLQDDPDLLLTLFHKTTENGSSYIKRKGMYQSMGKMLTSRTLKYFIYLLTNLDKAAGSYFMMHRAVLSKVLLLKTKYQYASIMTAVCSNNLCYIEVVRAKRVEGKSSYTFIKRIMTGYKALHCAWHCRVQNNF